MKKLTYTELENLFENLFDEDDLINILNEYTGETTINRTVDYLRNLQDLPIDNFIYQMNRLASFNVDFTKPYLIESDKNCFTTNNLCYSSDIETWNKALEWYHKTYVFSSDADKSLLACEIEQATLPVIKLKGTFDTLDDLEDVVSNLSENGYNVNTDDVTVMLNNN